MLTAGCRKAAEVLLPTTHDRDIASGCKVHATRPQLPFPMSTNPQARNLGFCRENPRWSLVSNEAGAGLPVYDNHIALSAARHPHCNVGNEALRCACAACADPGNDFDAPTVAARGSDGIALGGEKKGHIACRCATGSTLAPIASVGVLRLRGAGGDSTESDDYAGDEVIVDGMVAAPSCPGNRVQGTCVMIGFERFSGYSRAVVEARRAGARGGV
jgi:hypothetical protein